MQMIPAIDATPHPERTRVTPDRYQAPSKGDIRHLNKLLRVIEEFRKERPAIPASYISSFLVVATKPGSGPTEYAKDLGVIQPTVSRMLNEIGVKAREREEPLKWVDRVEDPLNARQKKFFMTSKGQALLKRVLDIMDE